MGKKVRNVAIGTFVVGAAGYLAGILTAPKSGRETRTYINSLRSKSMVEGEKSLKKLHTELSQLLTEIDTSKLTGKKTSKKLQAIEGEVVEKASRTKQKVREILSAVHDGSADDKDLDKAVSEAGKTIKSLRKYLKK